MRFDEATWGDAFFHFRTPNNHVLYSVVARAWHEVWWRPKDGAGDAYFSEVAYLDYQKTVITAGFLMQNSIYDPGLREFKTVEELRALMEEAGRTGRDVAVTYGQPQLGRLVYPEIMAVLDDPAVFRPVAVLPGQEAYCTRHIVRHTPAAAR